MINVFSRALGLVVAGLLLLASGADAATVRLAWDPNPEADIGGYRISYGTAPGLYTATVDAGNATTLEISGLADGQTYYFVVRAYNSAGSVSAPSAEIVGLATGDAVIPLPVPARLTSPAPSSVVNSTIQLTWDTGTSVSSYWLNVGTSRGGYDLYSGFKGTSRSAEISGLPLTGGPVWVRLLSYSPLGWLFRDHQFTSMAPGPGAVTSPANGQMVTATAVQITWTPGVGVEAFWLDVGTSQGGYDIYSGYKGQSLASNVTLPAGASRIWIRLRSRIGGEWRISDSSFLRPAPTPSRITSPLAGAALSSSAASFTWDAGVGVESYWVNIGRQPGGYELYSNYLGLSRALNVTGLPLDGGPVWVRLMSRIGGSWQWTDHRFTAASLTPAQVTSPAAGSRLDSDTVVLAWSAGVGVEAYWVNVGTSQGGYDVYSGYMGLSRSARLTIRPTTGPIWVRLLSLIGGQWRFVDHVYSAAGPTPAQILTPDPASAITAGSVVFTWSQGRGVAGYWLDVGTAQGSYDVSSGYRGMSQSAVVTDVPPGTVWVRLWSLIDGTWRFVDRSYVSR